MVANKSTLALLLLFGGLALSAVLLAADLKFLGVMVGVIAVPAAVHGSEREQRREVLLIEAFLWGAFASSSLLVGGVLALRLGLGERVIGLVSAFGAGVLISAVAYELFLEASETAEDRYWVGFGLFAGAFTFFLGDTLIDRMGGEGRKSMEGRQAGGAALAIVLGIVLDGIPESFVVGIGLLSGEGISAAFVAAVFLQPARVGRRVGRSGGRLAAEANLRPLGRRDRGRGSGGGGRLRRSRRRIGRLHRVRARFRGRRDPDHAGRHDDAGGLREGGKAAGSHDARLRRSRRDLRTRVTTTPGARGNAARGSVPRTRPRTARHRSRSPRRRSASRRRDRQPGSAQRPDADRELDQSQCEQEPPVGDVAIREGADNVEDSARDHEDPDEDAERIQALVRPDEQREPGAGGEESGDDVRRAVAAVQGLVTTNAAPWIMKSTPTNAARLSTLQSTLRMIAPKMIETTPTNR